MTSDVFEQTAGEIITDALIDARIISAEQPIQAKDIKQGLKAIKYIFKSWQSQGLHLWKDAQILLPLIKDRRRYIIGPDGDPACLEDGFFITDLSTSYLSGVSEIVPASINGENIYGQDLTMGFGHDLYVTNPLLSLAGWETGNSATISQIGPTTIQIQNGADELGFATLDMPTEAGKEYIVNVGTGAGTSDCVFQIIDQYGDLPDSPLVLPPDIDEDLFRFTSRDSTTKIKVSINTATTGLTCSVSLLNYRDTSEGDYIGVTLDDGTVQWNRIAYIYEPFVTDTKVVVLRDALAVDASIDNLIYTYKEQAPRPRRVLQAQYSSTYTSSEIPVNQWSRQEYFDQTDKGSSGTVVNWYYSPQLDNGELYVWQVASNNSSFLRFTIQRPIKVPTSSNDYLDIPSEFEDALKWAIAAHIAPSRGVKTERQLVLENNKATALDNALSGDVERDSISIQPEYY